MKTTARYGRVASPPDPAASGQRGLSLVQRLQAMESGHIGQGQWQTTLLVDSIVENLTCCLNVRQGGAWIANDYGLPEFSGLSTHCDVLHGELAAAIKACVIKFEPRLSQVGVRALAHSGDPWPLCFAIDAVLARAAGADSVHFETRLDRAGQVTVRR